MKFKNIKKKVYKKKSPSNSRTIPASAKASAGKPAKSEHSKFSFTKINHVTLFKLYRGALRVFVVTIFIVAAIIVGFDFKNNLQVKGNIESQREVLSKDLRFWEDFISKHQDYRDAYFQASILEYKLGDTSKAKMYAAKGLVLDPNSESGKKLEQFLVNK